MQRCKGPDCVKNAEFRCDCKAVFLCQSCITPHKHSPGVHVINPYKPPLPATIFSNLLLQLKYSEKEVLKVTQIRLKEISEVSNKTLKFLWQEKIEILNSFNNSKNLPADYPGKLQKKLLENITNFYEEVYKYTVVEENRPNVIVQLEHGEYIGEMVNHMPNGLGAMRYFNGDSYEGNFENGLRKGLGVGYYPNGEWYKGEWDFDKKHGSGVYNYENQRYEGQWQNGKKHGSGVYSFTKGREKGNFFEGQWENDLRHGKGIEHVGKTRFEGEWKENLKHGQFIHVFTDQSNKEIFNTEYYEDGNKVPDA